MSKDIIVLVVILAIILAALMYLYINKDHKKCIGCPCSGNCKVKKKRVLSKNKC